MSNHNLIRVAKLDPTITTRKEYMESKVYTIQLDPAVAAAEQRAVFEHIPSEHREAYLAHLSPALAKMVSAQTTSLESVLQTA
jgi:hypothetical protein